MSTSEFEQRVAMESAHGKLRFILNTLESLEAELELNKVSRTYVSRTRAETEAQISQLDIRLDPTEGPSLTSKSVSPLDGIE